MLPRVRICAETVLPLEPSTVLLGDKKIKLAKKMSFKRMTEVSDLPLSSV